MQEDRLANTVKLLLDIYAKSENPICLSCPQKSRLQVIGEIAGGDINANDVAQIILYPEEYKLVISSTAEIETIKAKQQNLLHLLKLICDEATLVTRSNDNLHEQIYLSPEEMGQQVGRSASTIIRWIIKGRVKGFQLPGRQWRVRTDDWQEFMKKCQGEKKL